LLEKFKFFDTKPDMLMFEKELITKKKFQLLSKK